MIKLTVFVFFWLAVTQSLGQADWIMLMLLLPTFLLIYAEAEDLDSEQTTRVQRQEPLLGD